MDSKDRLLAFLSSGSYEPMTVVGIIRAMGLEKGEAADLLETLDAMLEDKEIRMTKRGKVKPYPLLFEEAEEKEAGRKGKKKKKKGDGSEAAEGSQPEKELEPVRADQGFLRGNRKGFAFFIPDDPEADDVFISPDHLNHALNGDRVQIRLVGKEDKEKNRKADGEVVKILQRNPAPIVGTYQKEHGFGFVIPDDKSNFKDIYVLSKNSLGAANKDKVVCRLLEGGWRRSSPEGEIVEVIGPEGGKGVDISSIACSYELPYEFSQASLKEIKKIPTKVSSKEKEGRKDLRKLFTVTIDGPTAKDFDDAISVEKRGYVYTLYVHIADVTHYVKEGSAINADAYLRGNSTYLLDRVIPMLPTELSNGICSLNPGVDRLCMTTEIKLDKRGEVMGFEVYPSVIRSNHRLVYSDVSDYMERGIRFDPDPALYKPLDIMHEIYGKLAAQRRARGTLDFDFPETEVTLDEEGKPVQVGLVQRRTADQVIEEFMILNNQVIGSYFADKNLPFIYRIHGEPDGEKLDRLNQGLTAFGYPPLSGHSTPGRLRELLEKAKGRPEEGILNSLVLQSMQKAVYSPSPSIHFGLAIDHYSHFTAPIRRYSDLIAHRLLKSQLAGKARKDKETREELVKKTQHISTTERRSEEAERAVTDMKCAEYMQAYIGQTFQGMVSSLTDFGVFIMLPNSIEGLAHFRDMTDDYYTYDKEHFVVRGERTHQRIHYGDRVEVLLAAASPVDRRIDFKLLKNISTNYKPVDRTPEERRQQTKENRNKKQYGKERKKTRWRE